MSVLNCEFFVSRIIKKNLKKTKEGSWAEFSSKGFKVISFIKKSETFFCFSWRLASILPLNFDEFQETSFEFQSYIAPMKLKLKRKKPEKLKENVNAST